MDNQPEVLSLTPAEHALYSSGIRRGHSESLRQLAGQLREAGKAARVELLPTGGRQTKKGLLEALERVFDGYESFAAQLEGPAAEAQVEQQELLTQFCATRVRPRRPLAVRLRAVAIGALGAWRQQ